MNLFSFAIVLGVFFMDSKEMFLLQVRLSHIGIVTKLYIDPCKKVGRNVGF